MDSDDSQRVGLFRSTLGIPLFYHSFYTEGIYVRSRTLVRFAVISDSVFREIPQIVAHLTKLVKYVTFFVMNLHADMQARRAIEDRAIALGNERRALDSNLAVNTQAIIDLLRDAQGAGIPYEHLAEMVGVSRQTLHRWREVARKLTLGESAADMAARRNAEGHVLHHGGTR